MGTQGVTMSAILLSKEWIWSPQRVTFGTMGEPCEPQGAKTCPWKGQNSQIGDSSKVLTHFVDPFGVGGKDLSPGDDSIMQPLGFARGEAWFVDALVHCFVGSLVYWWSLACWWYVDVSLALLL